MNNPPFNLIRNKMRQQIANQPNQSNPPNQGGKLPTSLTHPIPTFAPSIVGTGIHLVGATLTLKCRFCNETFQSLDKIANNALMEVVANINAHASKKHPQEIAKVQKKILECVGILGTIASLGHVTYLANTETEKTKLTEIEDSILDQVDKYVTDVHSFVEEFYIANKLEMDLGEDEEDSEEESEEGSREEREEKSSSYIDKTSGQTVEVSPRLPVVDSVAPQDNPPSCIVTRKYLDEM